MVSRPPLSAGPTRMCDSSPQDVRDTTPDDAARSIETGREAIVLEDTPVPYLLHLSSAQAGIDGREQAESRPVQLGPPAGSQLDKVIVDEARRGHWHLAFLGGSEREAQVLGGQPYGESGRGIALVDNLAAVSLMDPGIEQRVCQHVIGQVAVNSALSQQRQDLAHAFER